MTIGVASTSASISRATGWLHDPRAVVRPVLGDSGGSLGGDGGDSGVSGYRGGAEGNGPVADITTGPGSTRPAPFAGAGSAFGPSTVIVRDSGGWAGPRRSDRLTPGLIRSRRRAR